MSDLVVTGLRKSYGNVLVLDDVGFDAKEGELLTLLGPSGCGKSTTLWSIAGLAEPDGGTVRFGTDTLFDSERRTNVPPEHRRCGVVFQSYAIWPHLTVRDNVGYPLKRHRVPRAERRARTDEVLAFVEMERFADRYPHELSGGQQQRVALARALAHPPRLLLLDEPFSNLDAKLRERARDWVRDIQRRSGVTMLFVTHDQDEALAMSDRIVMMQTGRVQQIGSPEEIYRRPGNRFVAQFLGTSNLLDGMATRRTDGATELAVPGLPGPVLLRTGTSVEGPATASFRPERVEIRTAPAQPGPTGPNTYRGLVQDCSFRGDHHRIVVKVGGVELAARTDAVPPSGEVLVRLPVEDVPLFAEEKMERETSDV